LTAATAPSILRSAQALNSYNKATSFGVMPRLLVADYFDQIVRGV
jgi:hypothetical protein